MRKSVVPAQLTSFPKPFPCFLWSTLLTCAIASSAAPSPPDLSWCFPFPYPCFHPSLPSLEPITSHPSVPTPPLHPEPRFHAIPQVGPATRVSPCWPPSWVPGPENATSSSSPTS